MYLEADTRHDVTHVYTATCTGAAETSWQAEQAVSVSANINLPHFPLNLSHSIDIWFVFQ